MCHCGKPLHYTMPVVKEFVEEQIRLLGEYIHVQNPDGTFLVPRHYLALHGLSGNEVHLLGFEKIQ